jgi:hypothetical protein
MQGENFVSLQGQIMWPELKTVGANNSKLFKGKLAIPITDRSGNDRKQYLKIAAWNQVAESLAEVDKDVFIKIHGHIEERSYEGKCKHCQGDEKKYWTEVLVDNFMVAEEQNV